MTRSDSLQADLARLQTKKGVLAKELGKQRDVAAQASGRASKKRTDAMRTKVESTRRSATSTAEREDAKAAAALKKMGDVESTIATIDTAVVAKQRQLTSALATEQRARDRDAEQRRRTEVSHARQLARITPPRDVRYVQVQPPAPEPLRVLYLTANPAAVETITEHPDGTVERTLEWLRVDREVREVKQRLRSSRYRDRVVVEHLPAARWEDLRDGLNDHRPHVVHFSGHASSWSVVLEDEVGSIDGDDLDFALLARTLSTTDTPPSLVVLNACESLAGVEPLLQTVPVAIGMAASIDDTSAIVFAVQFYAAIASAQSVASALDQARLTMERASLDGADLPQARCRDDVDLRSLVLVQPVPQQPPPTGRPG